MQKGKAAFSKEGATTPHVGSVQNTASRTTLERRSGILDTTNVRDFPTWLLRGENPNPKEAKRRGKIPPPPFLPTKEREVYCLFNSDFVAHCYFTI